MVILVLGFSSARAHELLSPEEHAYLARHTPVVFVSQTSYPPFEFVDGVGLPDGFDWRKSESMGISLIRILTEGQLKGTIEETSETGTRFIIRFNLQDYSRDTRI